MKKLLTMSVAAFMAVMPIAAESYFSDSFNYDEGALYGKGIWAKYGSKTSAPIQVVDTPLSFPNYCDNTKGRAVALTKESGEYTQALFRDKTAEPLTTTVYYSALIQLTTQPSGSRTAAFMALTGANQLDPDKFGDAVAGSEGAGLFAQASGDGFLLGVSRNVANMGNQKSAVAWTANEYALNTTYLVVVKYEPKDGADNDQISLWINPAKSPVEPAADVVAEETASESLVNIRGIELRQGSSAMAKTPDLIIDEVRVASQWSDLFTADDTQAEKPEITTGTSTVDFGKSYRHLTYTKTVNVKAKNLKSDISITAPKSGAVTCDRQTISKAEAESADGCNITLTLNVVDTDNAADNISLASDGATARNIAISWRPIDATAVSSLKQLYDEDNISMTTVYVYKGEAIVTAIDSHYYTFYAQDDQSAAEIRSASGCGYDEVDLSKVAQGDKITDIVANVVFSDDGGIDLVPVAADAWRVISSGNTVQPTEMTFGQIYEAEPANAMFKLIKVKNVRFNDKYAAYPDPEYYGKFNVPFHMVEDPTANGEIWYFYGTDIYKSSTAGYFDNTWQITGICYYLTPTPAVAPRSLADFLKTADGSVNSLRNDEADIQTYYDIHGLQVTNPAPGFYIIRRTDGTTDKVLIK